MRIPELDIRTIIALLVVGNLTVILLLLVHDLRTLKEFAMRSFLLGKIFQAIAWALLWLRGMIPDPLSVNVGNSFLLLGFGLECHGLASADRGAPRWRPAFGAVALLGILAFNLIAGSEPNLRVAVVSLATTGPYGLLAAAMLSGGRSSSLRLGIGVSDLVYCAILLVRAGAVLFGGAELGLLTPGLVQSLSYLPLNMALIVGGVGGVLLLKERGDSLLRESELKYRSLVERAEEAIFITQDDRLAFANRRMGELLGLPEPELIGLPLIDFVWHEDRDLVLGRHRARIEGRDPPDSCDFRLLAAGGEPHWVSVVSSTIPWRGSPAHLSLLTDIDRRKRSEERVEALLREKEALLKEVQHRVKNNLSLAMGLLSLQSGEVEEEGEDSPGAGVLRDARNRLQSMVQLYEMLQEGDEYREMGVRDYFGRLLDSILQAFPPRPAVRIELEVEDLVLDLKRLTTLGIIVNEIATNSMKYAFAAVADPLIRLSLSRDGESLRFRCGDNGPGLPPGLDPGNSSGLGLKLIGMLAGQLGAALSIERSGGTAFLLEFPLQAPPRPGQT